MVRLLVESFASPVCVVRGDVERAFPSISHFDVYHMLSSLGVPLSFLNILNEVYQGAESVGVVNGKPGGASGRCRWPVQGLRQGCPASPLLMALWVQNAVLEIKNKGSTAFLMPMTFGLCVLHIFRMMPNVVCNPPSLGLVFLSIL